MTGGRSEAAEPPACPEVAALQAVADGKIGDAIRAWKMLPRAEQSLRLGSLRTWGIEIEGGGTCFRSADCSKGFVSEQVDRLRVCAASRNAGASILIGTIALNELWSPRDLAAADRAFSRARIAKSAIPELGLSVVAYLEGSERTSRKLAETAVSLNADVDEYFVGYFFKNSVMFAPDYRDPDARDDVCGHRDELRGKERRWPVGAPRDRVHLALAASRQMSAWNWSQTATSEV